MNFPAIALVLLVLVAPFAEAQPDAKVARIGVLANIRSPSLDAFQNGLRDLGYVDGQNVIVEWRLAEGRFDRLPELAAELVRLNVDVIVAPGPPYVNAARDATATIPIVFALVPDPVGNGLVQSLGRPGGNITGLATNEVELHGKRVQMLKEAVPNLTHLAVLTNAGVDSRHQAVEHAAASLGIQHETVVVGGPQELDNAFGLMKAKRIGAVLEVPRSPFFYAHRQRIVDLALKSGLPMMCSQKEFVQAGCLFFYGSSSPDHVQRAAQYVHRILKGAKPGDLPIEQPTKYEFVVNLRSAKTLGMTIPQSLLLRADEVIE